MLSRSSSETQKLELLSAMSELKLHQAALERDNLELRDRLGEERRRNKPPVIPRSALLATSTPVSSQQASQVVWIHSYNLYMWHGFQVTNCTDLLTGSETPPYHFHFWVTVSREFSNISDKLQSPSLLWSDWQYTVQYCTFRPCKILIFWLVDLNVYVDDCGITFRTKPFSW